MPVAAAGKHPGLVLCHGFGGSCRGAGHPELARALEKAGYVVLRFDFRGCGQSEGRRGSVICAEEAADLGRALDFLAAHPAVDKDHLGAIGASLGGSLAIDVAARDPRIKLCVANGAIGDGKRRARHQYPDETSWQAFLQKIDDAERAGTTLNRYDVIYIPEQNRGGLPPGATMDFTPETALSLLELKPEAVIGRIAPRPVLLVHARGDRVVPVGETEALAAAGGANCDTHILESQDHFSSGTPALTAILLDFLGRHLPAR